jgi:hypothetical protein
MATWFGLLVAEDPALAREKLAAAMAAAQGNRSGAARLLGLHHRAFVRYLDRLGVREEMDAVWPPKVGRPSTTGARKRRSRRLHECAVCGQRVLLTGATLRGVGAGLEQHDCPTPGCANTLAMEVL